MANHDVTVHQLKAEGLETCAFLNVFKGPCYGGIGVWTGGESKEPTCEWRNAVYQHTEAHIVFFFQFNNDTVKREWEERNPKCEQVWPALNDPIPDLIEAAEMALGYFEECVQSCDPEEDEDESGDVPEAAKLRAAIAKAKGPTPANTWDNDRAPDECPFLL